MHLTKKPIRTIYSDIIILLRKYEFFIIKDDKNERILDTALDKFKQYGFLKSTVDDIARQTQVGKGTIYLYFQNKEYILNALTASLKMATRRSWAR